MSGFVTKRAFLAGSGAMVGTSLVRAVGPASRSRFRQGGRWEVIVLGAGTAGMPAAIGAARRGARVLLVDPASHIGGTLERAGGQIAGADTRFQKAKGILDTPQAHFEDIVRINHGTGDPTLIRLFAQHAGETIDWLAEHGFTIMPDQPIKGDAGEPFTTARYLWGPERGRSILKVIRPLVEQGVESGRITLALRSRAVELLQDSAGSVNGVIIENVAGERIEHQARNVVLATGGCAANPRLFEKLHRVPLYARWAYPYSQGDGIGLGQAAGGFVRGGDKYLPDFGRILADRDYPSPVFASAAVDPHRRPPWEIFVNTRGARFVPEDHPSPDYREHALGLQPGQRYFVVFDQSIREQAPPLLPTLSTDTIDAAFESHPMFAMAPSLDALAERAGIDGARLIDTVQQYNAAVAVRHDPLGRQFLPVSLSRAPYYSIELQGVTLMSFAGLAVDDRLRVTRPDGHPIPNLYAAGELLGAGAMSGNAHTSGMMAGGALTFGRLVGEELLPLG